MKQHNGFSLVELLVVIVIISIISAVAIPAYKSYILSSKIRETLAVLESYQEYTLKIYAKKGILPKGGEILFPDDPNKINDASSIKTVDLSYVDQVSAVNGGTYITLGARLRELNDKPNNTVYFQGKVDTTNGGFLWKCGTPASKTDTIEDKYLPNNCKSKDLI